MCTYVLFTEIYDLSTFFNLKDKNKKNKKFYCSTWRIVTRITVDKLYLSKFLAVICCFFIFFRHVRFAY